MTLLPFPRKGEIVSQEIDGEVLLYDLNIHKSYCLNQTAALVWKNCDGKTPVSEFAAKTGLPEEMVWLALEQFDKENLLAEKFESPLPKNRVSRRKVLTAMGAMAMALPLVSSMIAPTAAHAQSACRPNGQDFCIAPQVDTNACVNAIFPLEMTACCAGTFTVVTFDNPVGSNSCCGTCGPRIG